MTLEYGDWRCVVDGGVVGDLEYRGRRVLSQVAFVVRDAVWGTSEPDVSVARAEESGVSLRGRTTAPDVAWELSARLGDEVVIEATARMDAPCSTNRIGLVALHPRTWAGTPCELTHTDGSRESSCFPAEVAPHQPFRDLGTLTHLLGEARIDVVFEGDVFETEDQRNWGDASFKTYSRPLDLPAPYRLAAGDVIRQRIRVRARGDFADDDPEPQPAALVCPPVGCTVTTADDLATASALGLDHVRVEYRLGEDRSLLWAALAQPLPVHLALFLPEGSEPALAELSARLLREGVAPAQVHGYSEPGPLAPVTTDADIARLAAHVSSWPGRPRLFVGTDHNLAELNRNPMTLVGDVDGVVFAFNPQVHDRSEAGIRETPSSLPDMVETVRLLYPGRDVAVAPITLRPRRSVHVEPLPRLDETLATDPRQSQQLTADWVWDVLARLGQAGVDHATIFETTGPRGWVGADGHRNPSAHVLTQLTRGERN